MTSREKEKVGPVKERRGGYKGPGNYVNWIEKGASV
jgi:hypothetical protein